MQSHLTTIMSKICRHLFKSIACTPITGKNLSTSIQLHSDLRRSRVTCRHLFEFFSHLRRSQVACRPLLKSVSRIYYDHKQTQCRYLFKFNHIHCEYEELVDIIQIYSQLLRSQVNLSTPIYSNLFAFTTSMSNVSTTIHIYSH